MVSVILFLFSSQSSCQTILPRPPLHQSSLSRRRRPSRSPTGYPWRLCHPCPLPVQSCLLLDRRWVAKPRTKEHPLLHSTASASAFHSLVLLQLASRHISSILHVIRGSSCLPLHGECLPLTAERPAPPFFPTSVSHPSHRWLESRRPLTVTRSYLKDSLLLRRGSIARTAAGSRRISRLSRDGSSHLKRSSAQPSDSALTPRSHIIPEGEYIGSYPYMTSRLIRGRVMRLDYGMRMLRESAREGLREGESDAISSSAFFSTIKHFTFHTSYTIGLVSHASFPL